MPRPVWALLGLGVAISLAGPIVAAAQPAPTVSRETTTVQSYDGRSMPAEVVRLRVSERRADG